jgi:hypothetical protein
LKTPIEPIFLRGRMIYLTSQDLVSPPFAGNGRASRPGAEN